MRQFSQGYLKIIIRGKGYVSRKRIFSDTFGFALLVGWGTSIPVRGGGFLASGGREIAFSG